jgi:hypothetical protein
MTFTSTPRLARGGGAHGQGYCEEPTRPRLHRKARAREKERAGSGGSLEAPGPLLTHIYTVNMESSECLPTRLKPMAERTCCSQARAGAAVEEVGRRRCGAGPEPGGGLPKRWLIGG